MDKTAEIITAEGADQTADPSSQEVAWPRTYARDWGHHPINLRASLPTPFGRWYVTLVAGRERRRKERLIEDRKRHPLTTRPNLMFLFSTGIVLGAVLILVAAATLVHVFGWSIDVTVPA
ncbi:MAG: hypothetical protein ACR2QJ_13950 [Geminicoccaceae bacterium]